MAYVYRVLGALALVSGCSGPNPLFELDIDSLGGSSGDATTGDATSEPTSEPTTTPMSTTTGDTTGDATGDTTRTTSDATSDESTTIDATSEPGTTGTSTLSTDPVSDSDPMTGGPVCGDAMLDDNEECDEGPENGTGGACTGNCTLTICGDGYKGGDEQCDLGNNNSDFGDCTEACALPACGDGLTNGAENCDSGPGNGKGPKLCSADCKTEIPEQTKKILLTPGLFSGKLVFGQTVGIFAGDEWCGGGFHMMAASAGARTASTGAFDGEGQESWVLDPYTAYVNAQNVVVFVTGAKGLLGVIDGQPADLLAPIGAGKVWTGLKPTWQTAAETCSGWDTAGGAVGMVGDAAKLSGDFLSVGTQACDIKAHLYCVQQ